ncbi:MAG: hypothetical protein II811_10120, partial [Spirochaetaceae bacterium]|nr:hypothetical protein [Spirochaetaceae bacterium]
WRRIYDSETRGAKMSIHILKKKVANANSIDELFDIVMNNTHRFSDANGKPLAIVKELKAAVDEKKKTLNADKPSTKAQIDDWKKQNKKKGVAARLRDEFTENTNKYLDHSFKNNATGIEAKFSKESQKELKSRTDNTKSNGFTLKEHFEVANQIKELFENATLENTHDDTKHGENNVKIERFLSKEITLKSGKKAQACITVKHSLDKDGRIIYSLEAMDIKNALEKTRAKGQPNNRTVHTSESITHTSDSVNGGIVKYRGYTIRDIKDGDKDFRNMDREKYVVVETPRGNAFMLPVLREKAHKFIDEAAKDAIEEAEVYAKVKGYGEQERLMLLESYAENQKTKRGHAAKRILQQVKKHGDVDFDRFEKYFLVDVNEVAKDNSVKQFDTVDEVKAFYKGTAQWLKAPNGKDTKLTEKQWCQVRTKNFKNWFGDWENAPDEASKIVDENGEPEVLYHGTQGDFDTFEKEHIGNGNYWSKGFYFTNDESAASFYGGIMSCFVNIKNPFPLRNKKDAKLIEKIVGESGIPENEMVTSKGTVSDSWAKYVLGYKADDQDAVVEKIKKAGYGGLEILINKNSNTKYFVSYEPSQIKSATDNNGDFDVNSTSIKKSV